jgi:hypothetical protein
MSSNEENTNNSYGTIVNVNPSKGVDVQFDIFPLEDNIVRYSMRNKLTVLEDDVDDGNYNQPTDMMDGSNICKTYDVS